MLFSRLDGRLPGHEFRYQTVAESRTWGLAIDSISERPIERVEVIVNGRVAQTLRVNAQQSKQFPQGGFQFSSRLTLKLRASSWVAVRSIERQPSGRIRFAHTAPWHITVGGHAVRPRESEIDFLIACVKRELQRSSGLLPDSALREFRTALALYESIRERAKANDAP